MPSKTRAPRVTARAEQAIARSRILDNPYFSALRDGSMSMDADRLRRTFDDNWLLRILYPGGLLIPWFAPGLAYRSALGVYGAVLLCAWLLGIAYVKRKGLLRVRPADPSLLRNMVYFPKLPR